MANLLFFYAERRSILTCVPLLVQKVNVLQGSCKDSLESRQSELNVMGVKRGAD